MMKKSFKFHVLQVLLFIFLSLAVFPTGARANLILPCDDFHGMPSFYKNLKELVVTHGRGKGWSQLCEEVSYLEEDLWGDNIANAINSLNRFITRIETKYTDSLAPESQTLVINEAKRLIGVLKKTLKLPLAPGNDGNARMDGIDLDRDGVSDEIQKEFKIQKHLAEQGDAKAQNFIGLMYLRNKVFSSDPYNEALKWIHKAAEQGLAQAQYNLGVVHFQLGHSNYRKTVKLILDFTQQDLDQGRPLRKMIYSYLGYKNYSEAVKWHRRSAEQGDIWSQVTLGQKYSDGHGVDKDMIEAYKWLRLAIDQPFPENLEEYRQGFLRPREITEYIRENAQSRLSRIVKAMTSREIKQGEQLVTEWQANH